MAEADPAHGSATLYNAGANLQTLSIAMTSPGLYNDVVAVQMNHAIDTFDLRQLEYTSTVDRNLICPICRVPFIDPVRLPCDHIFCRDCINETFDSQPSQAYHCPSCRAAANDSQILPVSRALVQMVNELEVICPNSEAGCSEKLPREDIEDHIRKYCAYTEVNCSIDDCMLPIQRRYAGHVCRHSLVVCYYCREEMMQKDLDHHLLEACKSFMTTCPACGSQTIQHNLKSHISTCSQVEVPCVGSTYGCKHVSKRSSISEHISTCAIAALAPYLQQQSSRLDAQARTISHLQHKNDILETSLSSIQAVLGTTDPVLPPLPTSTSANSTSGPVAPFDNTTHHLLSLHESLREEIDRVTAAVQELDARSSLMVMNESLRTKEDLAHTNAALNSMRVQLHWLMSARLQAHPARAGSAAGSAAAAAAGSSSMPAGRVNGSGAMQPLRRLSDSTRQDTKL